MPAAPRAIGANTFLLAIDGKEAAVLQFVEGGHITADVITEHAGQSGISKKHISEPHYQPVIFGFGMSTVPAIKDWIQAFFERKHSRRNISIITLGVDYKPISETEYLNALIVEVALPKMDGASKEADYLTVKVQPEVIRPKKVSG